MRYFGTSIGATFFTNTWFKNNFFRAIISLFESDKNKILLFAETDKIWCKNLVV